MVVMAKCTKKAENIGKNSIEKALGNDYNNSYTVLKGQNLECRGKEMEEEIQEFMSYLENVKKTSENTRLSYQRDLHKLQRFLGQQAVLDIQAVTMTNLNSYILYLEKEHFAASTISRNIAAIKSFYHFLWRKGSVKDDISEQLKAPKVQRQAPEVLTREEMERLLCQPNEKTPKGMRDKAMLELLYATGIRVSEVIALKVADVNLMLGYIVCRDTNKERFIPINQSAAESLNNYLKQARDIMVGDNTIDNLFVNCSGRKLSRQGIWKMMKGYAKKAEIDTEITPHTIRHSFAFHLMGNGADIHAVQEMMGHSDVSSTQVYAHMLNSKIYQEYKKAHPRF